MKPTHDDTIEAKEVKIQLSFGRYKGKLVLHNKIQSVYINTLSCLYIEQRNYVRSTSVGSFLIVFP